MPKRFADSVLSVAVALWLAACAPALTPAEQQVHLQTSSPFGCTEVGVFHSPGDSVHHSPDDLTDTSHSGMRNDAAELGANYVALAGRDRLGSTVTGHAFRCDVAPTQAPNLTAAPAPSASSPAASPADSAPGSSPGPEVRLRKLKDLLDKGLITPEEYDRQRTVILQSF